MTDQRESPTPGDLTTSFSAEASTLLGYFARRVTPTEDAADLLSETFLIAWRKQSKQPVDAAEMRPWLFGIARKVLSQHRRGKLRRVALGDRVRTLLSTESVAGIDGTSHADDGLGDHVRELIRLLPPLDQEIITLVYWEGFTQEEVATIIGKPAATVRSRLTRARATLRTQLVESCDAG